MHTWWSWSPTLATAAVLGAQQVQLQVLVTQDWQLDLEHGVLGPPEHRRIPAPTVLGEGDSRWLRAATGACTADGHVAVQRDAFGNAELLLGWDCQVRGRHNGNPASATTAGELLLTLRASTPTRGTLVVAIDTSGSFGPQTVGDLQIDVGDDGRGEIGHGTATPWLLTREFGCTATPAGTPIRITQAGNAIGDDDHDAAFVARLRLTFLPGCSPAVPWLPGPEQLAFLRLPTGTSLISFATPPGPTTFCFVAVGEPVAPATRQLQLASPWMRGEVHTTFAAVRMLGSPTMTIPPRLLPGTGRACLQGFVFTPGGLATTNSWVFN